MRKRTLSYPSFLALLVAAPLAAQTTRVSVGTPNVEADQDSYAPDLSADGRFVAFQSVATNFTPNDTNLDWDIFVHDRVSGVTTLVRGGARVRASLRQRASARKR